MFDSLLSLLFAAKDVFPLGVASSLGVVLFGLSWVHPRRIVSLPAPGSRRRVLVWTGVAGGLAVALVTTAVSALNVWTPDTSGFDGWWRRPAPLVSAAIVLTIAALALRRVPLPAPGERAITPRRPWDAFTPRALLWISGIAAALVALPAAWQMAIATTAPASGPFYGLVPEHSPLPIYMSFNGGFGGFIAGAGWPNHLATLGALVVACLVLILTLRADANRPIPLRSSAPSIRLERERTAWLFTLLLLAGLIATLGAVWMHLGSTGSSTVGIGDPSAEGTFETVRFVNGSYSAIARPMNLVGHVIQAAGFALALRLAVDTARAAVVPRKRAGEPTRVDMVAK